MIDITAIFDNLKSKDLQDHTTFYACPLPVFTNHRIGKSIDGKALLFLSAQTKNGYNNFPNIKLQNLSVIFNAYCNIIDEETTKEGIFTIISFLGNSTELQNYFLKLSAQIITTLGNTPSQAQIHSEIYRLIELLKALSHPPLKTVQGLFAELLIIEQANDLPTFIQAWHTEPTDIYDFTHQTQHLEVKSNAAQKRQHHFSIEQLTPPQNHSLVIASVFVEQANNGIIINQLTELIFKQLPNRRDLQNTLNLTIAKTLGSSIIDAQTLKFNYELAKHSIAFYNIQNIPKINQKNIPPQITDLRFKLDLSEVPNFTHFSFEF